MIERVSMQRAATLTALGATLALGGCMSFIPAYQRPAAPVAAAYAPELLPAGAETGVAAEHDRGKVASVTYTWRRSMGTVLYAGASYSKSALPLPAISRGAAAFVKLQFDFDEMRRML